MCTVVSKANIRQHLSQRTEQARRLSFCNSLQTSKCHPPFIYSKKEAEGACPHLTGLHSREDSDVAVPAEDELVLLKAAAAVA